MTRLFTIAALLLLSAGGVARAQGATAVVPVPGAGDMARTMGHAQAILRTLQDRGRPVVDASLGRLGAEEAFRLTAGTAIEALSEGELALDSFELDTAVDRLGEAVQMHGGALEGLDVSDSYLRAQLLLTAAALLRGGMGDEELARRAGHDAMAWRLAARLPPPMSESVTGLTDELWRFVESLDISGTATLTVKAPAAASVYVNWRPMGVAPLTLERLPRGRVLVQVTRPGFRPFTEWVTLTPGSNQTLEAVLEADDDKVWFDELMGRLPAGLGLSEVDPSVDDILRWSGSNDVIMVLSCGDTVEAHWFGGDRWQRRTRQDSQSGVVAAMEFAQALMGGSPQLDERSGDCESDDLDIDLGLTSDAEILASGVSRRDIADCWSGAPCPQGSRCEGGRCVEVRPIYQEWWFLTAIGAVVAGAAVGTALYLTQPDDRVVRIR